MKIKTHLPVKGSRTCERCHILRQTKRTITSYIKCFIYTTVWTTNFFAVVTITQASVAYRLKYVLNFPARGIFFKYQIVFTGNLYFRNTMLSCFCAKPTNILAARCTNNGYICTWLDLKRDNHYLPKLFYTMHASGRIFMRNLNISVVVLASHTQVIYSSVCEIIETAWRTFVPSLVARFLFYSLVVIYIHSSV